MAQKSLDTLTQLYGAPRLSSASIFHVLPCVYRFVGRQELECAVKDLKYWVMCRFQEMGQIPIVNATRLVGDVAPDPTSPIVQVGESRCNVNLIVYSISARQLRPRYPGAR